MEKIERSMIYPEKTHCIVKESDLDELERQRDEAVDIVVDYTRALEDSGRKWLARWTRNISFLEKITGQTWEEIKEGYKND